MYLAVGQSLHGPLGVRPFLCVHWGSILKTTLVGSRKLDPGAADSGLRDATDEAVDQPPVILRRGVARNVIAAVGLSCGFHCHGVDSTTARYLRSHSPLGVASPCGRLR